VTIAVIVQGTSLVGRATIALACLTFVLAGAALVSAWFTRRALGAAQRDTVEAIKARIDQQAPRTAIFVIGAEVGFWHPDGEIRIPQPDEPLNDHSPDIGIFAWVRVFNEGRSTAMVELPPDCSVFGGKNASPMTLNELVRARPTVPAPYAMEPTQALLILMWASRSIAGWRHQIRLEPNEREPLRMTIKVDDAYRDGISDATTILFYGVPMSMAGNAAQTGPCERERVLPERTVRSYPHLPSGWLT
jgi:hypothetical protein